MTIAGFEPLILGLRVWGSTTVLPGHKIFAFSPGARKLTGDNLKLVWAEFSTLSQAVLMMSIYLFT